MSMSGNHPLGTAYPGHRRRPEPLPAAPYRPRDVVRELAGLLKAEGLTVKMFFAACPAAAVLSITPSLTVWYSGGVLQWTWQGQTTIWPVSDTPSAAIHLANLVRPDPR